MARRNANCRQFWKFSRGLIVMGILAIALGACEELPTLPPIDPPAPAAPLAICSFNVQFLGSFQKRDDHALAETLKKHECDLVTVQELVASPDFRLLRMSTHFQAEAMPNYPDGTPMTPSNASTEFFVAMENAGYDKFVMSPEKTGNSASVNNNSTAGEWFVTFYRSAKFSEATDLHSGWVGAPTAKNPDYDRVPYAMAFRDSAGRFDFVLLSVHLHPGPSKADRARRAVEFGALFQWINEQRAAHTEQDYIVLGDTNIEDAEELSAVESLSVLRSLNLGASTMTNTNVAGPKPYDHFFIDTSVTPEIAFEQNFEVLNLNLLMKEFWLDPVAPYPGDAYDHTLFRQHYSDHHPIKVTAQPLEKDDD